MSHFAHLDENNIVDQVIVAEQDVIDSGLFGDPSRWVQTSYNTHGGVHYKPGTWEPDNGVPLRKNYACIGHSYNKNLDAFIPPYPGEDCELDLESCTWKKKEKNNV